MRACTLPLILRSQRISGGMQEYLPEMQRLQRRFEDAQKSGDRFKVQMAAMELSHFMKEKHLPMMMKLFLPMGLNVSFFLGLNVSCFFGVLM